MASSLGVDDAWLRKRVDVVDVVNTKKVLKPKRKCQNEPRKIRKKFALKNLPGGSTARFAPVVPDGRDAPVVPMVWPVVPVDPKSGVVLRNLGGN